ncbi:MAG: hypothetical protein M1839_005626 [Geoglossum umbratile]|nr:MAG: hypothetical protein M1839_005626 [Geoglossum umbratile]
MFDIQSWLVPAAMRLEIDRVQRQAVELISRVEKLEKGSGRFRQKIEQLENRNVQLWQEVGGLEKGNAQFRQEIEQLENRNVQLWQEIEHLENENVRLRQEVEYGNVERQQAFEGPQRPAICISDKGSSSFGEWDYAAPVGDQAGGECESVAQASHCADAAGKFRFR